MTKEALRRKLRNISRHGIAIGHDRSLNRSWMNIIGAPRLKSKPKPEALIVTTARLVVKETAVPRRFWSQCLASSVLVELQYRQYTPDSKPNVSRASRRCGKRMSLILHEHLSIRSGFGDCPLNVDYPTRRGIGMNIIVGGRCYCAGWGAVSAQEYKGSASPIRAEVTDHSYQ